MGLPGGYVTPMTVELFLAPTYNDVFGAHLLVQLVSTSSGHGEIRWMPSQNWIPVPRNQQRVSNHVSIVLRFHETILRRLLDP